jgi:hypothetical protein
MIKLQMINRTTSSSSPYHPHRPFFDELKKKKALRTTMEDPQIHTLVLEGAMIF